VLYTPKAARIQAEDDGSLRSRLRRLAVEAVASVVDFFRHRDAPILVGTWAAMMLTAKPRTRKHRQAWTHIAPANQQAAKHPSTQPTTALRKVRIPSALRGIFRRSPGATESGYAVQQRHIYV